MTVENAVRSADFSGFIQPDIAQAYFEEAKRASVVQQLARQVPLSANGAAVPVVTSKPRAGWVAEGAAKPVSDEKMALKTIKPQKLAVIIPVSAEVVRANPGNFMNLIREDIGEAFAKAFDAAALHGTSSPFGAEQNLAATTKAVKLGTAKQPQGGLFGDVNSGLDLLAKARKKLNGFVFDDIVEPMMNTAMDTTGRPIFISAPTNGTAEPVRSGTLLGRNALFAEEVAPSTETGATVGFGGDFTKVVWGTVGGITFHVSTEAAVTIGGKLVSLFENNLVAVRAEAEYGSLVADKDAFVKYTI